MSYSGSVPIAVSAVFDGTSHRRRHTTPSSHPTSPKLYFLLPAHMPAGEMKDRREHEADKSSG